MESRPAFVQRLELAPSGEVHRGVEGAHGDPLGCDQLRDLARCGHPGARTRDRESDEAADAHVAGVEQRGLLDDGQPIGHSLDTSDVGEHRLARAIDDDRLVELDHVARPPPQRVARPCHHRRSGRRRGCRVRHLQGIHHGPRPSDTVSVPEPGMFPLMSVPSDHPGDPARLVDLTDGLARLVDDARGVAPAPEALRRRAERLAAHLAGHVLPRARLDAPLIIALVGPTGAGKSTLLNTLVGRPVSPTGVIRPTTRHAILVARPAAVGTLLAATGPLAAIADRVRPSPMEDAPTGLALVDAPDVDSIEHANRVLADRLVESADLAVFVTTGTRYADRVAWDVLERARSRPSAHRRRQPPPSRSRRTGRDVLADIDRLIEEQGLRGLGLAGDGALRSVDVVAVGEGDLDPGTPEALVPSAVELLRRRIDDLAADRDARSALAARALAGSLSGLRADVDALADELEHAAIDLDALAGPHATLSPRSCRLYARTSPEGCSCGRRRSVSGRRSSAPTKSRLFSSGIRRVRGTSPRSCGARLAPPWPRSARDTLADLRSLARGTPQKQPGARRPAGRTARSRHRSSTAMRRCGGSASTSTPGWRPGSSAGSTASARMSGRPARPSGGWRGAALGVNATGIAVMLATFSHTGGLTGAEVGVAAATGFLNQKLLEALFGEAALAEMIDHARRNLLEVRRRSPTSASATSSDSTAAMACATLPLACVSSPRSSAASTGRSRPRRERRRPTAARRAAHADDPTQGGMLGPCLALLDDALPAARLVGLAADEVQAVREEAAARRPPRRRLRPRPRRRHRRGQIKPAQRAGRRDRQPCFGASSDDDAPVAWVAESAVDDVATLLERLGVAGVRSHGGDHLRDVVIVDLPDIDSLSEAHVRTVTGCCRISTVAWVTDPRSDAVLDEFLRHWLPRLHRQVVIVNRIDRLDAGQADLLAHDLARDLPPLLGPGVRPVPVLLTSARRDTPDVDALRDWLEADVDAKRVVAARRPATRTALLELADRPRGPERRSPLLPRLRAPSPRRLDERGAGPRGPAGARAPGSRRHAGRGPPARDRSARPGDECGLPLQRTPLTCGRPGTPPARMAATRLDRPAARADARRVGDRHGGGAAPAPGGRRPCRARCAHRPDGERHRPRDKLTRAR